jgi:transcriptional regulator with XRE-family HTH domain
LQAAIAMTAGRGGGAVRSRRIDQHVGEQIRLRRTELGLTQDQLAEALKVSYQQIQKYESGANRISAGRIFEIARKLDVDVGWFFEGYVPEDDDGLHPAHALEHGGRQRTAIELVRKFAQIESAEVRAAIAGLVKTIVDRER